MKILKTIYKVINKNGKTFYYRDLDLDTDPMYNLEKNYYISEMKPDDDSFNEDIFIIDLYDAEREVSTYSPLYLKYENQNYINNILKQPLQIFNDLELLKNKEFLYKFIELYPNFLYTFSKKKYHRYISIYEILPLLVKYNIYPIKCNSSKLINLISSKDQPIKIQVYCYNFFKESIYEFHNHTKFIHNFLEDIYNFYIFSLDDYNYTVDEELENFNNFITHLCSYIYNNPDFINEIINDYEFSLQMLNDLIYYLHYSWFLEDSNFDRIFPIYLELENIYEKRHIIELENEYICNEELKHQLQLLDSSFINKSQNYTKIINIILKCIGLSNNPYLLEKELFNNRIPDSYLENREFLRITSKYKIPFFLYSTKYKDELEFIYNHAKRDLNILNFVNPEIFSKTTVVLTLRNICPYILFYAPSFLLNDEYFMFEYLSIYPIDKYFRLGNTLSKNIYFIKKAFSIDPNIIFYCNPNLYDNEKLMEKLFLEDNKIFFLLSNRLKNKYKHILISKPNYTM